ncbi:MAG: hypothetical protein RRY29_09290 [Desulfovibrionaceae bacterium]
MTASPPSSSKRNLSLVAAAVLMTMFIGASLRVAPAPRVEGLTPIRG